MSLVLRSIMQCPQCGFKVTERISLAHAVTEYHCQSCAQRFALAESDCCVFCRYGTVPCPKNQQEKAKL